MIFSYHQHLKLYILYYSLLADCFGHYKDMGLFGSVWSGRNDSDNSKTICSCFIALLKFIMVLFVGRCVFYSLFLCERTFLVLVMRFERCSFPRNFVIDTCITKCICAELPTSLSNCFLTQTILQTLLHDVTCHRSEICKLNYKLNWNVMLCKILAE